MQKTSTSKQFILRIEGQGEYLQNARWAWIRSVRDFKLKEKYKRCCDCFVSGSNPQTEIHKKVKTRKDYPFDADNAQIPINPKINAHNGEVPHYLCIDGAKDYLHIGFIYCEGSEIRGDFMGQTIIIKNAKNLHFDFSQNSKIGNKVRETYKNLVDDTRLECRNFWFGAYFYGDKMKDFIDENLQ